MPLSERQVLSLVRLPIPPRRRMVRQDLVGLKGLEPLTRVL